MKSLENTINIPMRNGRLEVPAKVCAAWATGRSWQGSGAGRSRCWPRRDSAPGKGKAMEIK